MELHKCSNDRMLVCYTFDLEEKQIIIKAAKSHIRNLEKKISKVYNNRKNEGQAKYSLEIDRFSRQINNYEKLISEFSK